MGERTVRLLADEAHEVERFLWCNRTAFLANRDVTDDVVAWVRERWDFNRTWAAFDDGELCGTTRSFPTGLRLPGLGEVPVSALTSVTVLPTHTRRGHVTRLMRAQLEAAVEAGEVASLLVAAEWPIYGRFGYGPCTEWVQWEVDVPRATFAPTVPGPVGRCELVDAETLAKYAAEVLGRQQKVTSGCIVRPPDYTRVYAGADERPGEEPKPKRVRLVHFDADGAADGYTAYDPHDRWDGMRPNSTLEVQDMAWATPEAERELWRYLLTVDLVTRIKYDGAPTTAVRHLLADGRAAHAAGRWDHLWAVLLDVPAALSARAYSGTGRVVVEVVDGFLGRGGTFVLDVSPDGASCTPAPGAGADLTLPVAALGAAWLGGTDLRAVAAGGTVDEHAPGALERLAALLRWHTEPACFTDF